LPYGNVAYGDEELADGPLAEAHTLCAYDDEALRPSA
jgi:hypothetical protein